MLPALPVEDVEALPPCGLAPPRPPLAPPLPDEPLSCELEPPPLLLLEEGALSCELELPPLLLLLLLEDGALSCELEPPPLLLVLLLLLEDDALSCELSEPPGCATAGLPPTRTSATSAENVTSDTVLLTTTLGTRWS
ncbi:MAG TPA: hypothetical protein VOA80_05375 [Thermoanaerobaculia bacterium]|nr:hypothetical protein [Thermoanaerobaculia bacterium]